jgi:hypothetical protein
MSLAPGDFFSVMFTTPTLVPARFVPVAAGTWSPLVTCWPDCWPVSSDLSGETRPC